MTFAVHDNEVIEHYSQQLQMTGYPPPVDIVLCNVSDYVLPIRSVPLFCMHLAGSQYPTIEHRDDGQRCYRGYAGQGTQLHFLKLRQLQTLLEIAIQAEQVHGVCSQQAWATDLQGA